MAEQAQPIPAGFHTVTPHRVVGNAEEAIAFYKKAFGAEEIQRCCSEGGGVMHAELKIGDSKLLLCGEMPEAKQFKAPTSLNGTSVCLHLYVQDADKAYQQAVDAGATPTMPLMDAFWGDRYGKVTDPFGHEWSIATHKKDLTPEEIKTGAEAFSKSMGGCCGA